MKAVLLAIVIWSVIWHGGAVVVATYPNSPGETFELCAASASLWARQHAAPCHDAIPFPVPEGLR